MAFEQLERSRILTPVEGYPPQIGMLIASLEYCRLKTMSQVATLTTYELDYQQDTNANTIGILLLHMAGVEFAVQQLTFHERSFVDDPASLGKWEVALYMGERARRKVRGHPVEYYFDEMAAVRQHTLEQFRQYDDTSLWQTCTWKTKWDIEARSTG